MDTKTGSHFEVANVERDHRETEVERGHSDLKAGKRNDFSHPAAFGVDSRGQLRHLPGEWLRGNCGEDLIQIDTASLALLRRAGSPETVFEFDHADCRHHDPLSLGDGGYSWQHAADRLSPGAQRQSKYSNRGLIPRGRIQRFPMRVDRGLHICGKIRIRKRRIAEALFVHLREGSPLRTFSSTA